MAKASFIPLEGALAQLFREAGAIAPLSPKEEYALAMRWREHEDKAAMHTLVSAHVRMIFKTAAKYRGYGMPTEDMVGAGTVGLMHAARKFEPERGFRFSTYAQWWIKASMQQHLLENWSLVKLGTTANQKKLFFNLRKVRGQIGDASDTHLSDENCEKIAKKLGVTADDVRLMEQRLNKDASLDAPMTNDPESSARVDFLESADPTPEDILVEQDEKAQRGSLLKQALAVLTDDRERDIFTQRRLRDPEDVATLEDLAVKYEISRERVRQIEVRAFEKIQKAVFALSQGEDITPMIESTSRSRRAQHRTPQPS